MFFPEDFSVELIDEGDYSIQKISTILQSAKGQVLDLNAPSKTKAFIACAQEKMTKQPAGNQWAIKNTCFINQLIGRLVDLGLRTQRTRGLMESILRGATIRSFVNQLMDLSLF